MEQKGEMLEVGRELGGDCSIPDVESEGQDRWTVKMKGRDSARSVIEMAFAGLNDCLDVRGGRGRNLGCLRF